MNDTQEIKEQASVAKVNAKPSPNNANANAQNPNKPNPNKPNANKPNPNALNPNKPNAKNPDLQKKKEKVDAPVLEGRIINFQKNEAEFEYGKAAAKLKKYFKIIQKLAIACILSVIAYFCLASDRYVSDATILIQNTKSGMTQSFDLASLVGISSSATAPDQLLLREHLLSIDMLRNLDTNLNLREHYSSTEYDFVSRLNAEELTIEDFYKYIQRFISIEYDDYGGVLKIRVEAFTPTMAKEIATFLVKEGENFMNEMSHNLARAQVKFLDEQVDFAYDEVLLSTEKLIAYQNTQGLASPTATAESVIGIIAGLEAQRTEFETQLAALPKNIIPNHPTKVMLSQSLAAVEKQILSEREKLASESGTALNEIIVQYERLQLDLDFKTDLYKTALVALEAGRMEASRTIKQVSVLQSPLLPESPLEPRRIYSIITTLLLGLFALGTLKLLEAVILDHVD